MQQTHSSMEWGQHSLMSHKKTNIPEGKWEGERLVAWHNLINKRQSLTQRMYRPASETYNQYRRLSRRGSPSFVVYYYVLSLLYSYKITSYKNKKVWSLERSSVLLRCEMSIHERTVSPGSQQPRVCSSVSLTECLLEGERLPCAHSHNKSVRNGGMGDDGDESLRKGNTENILF